MAHRAHPGGQEPAGRAGLRPGARRAAAAAHDPARDRGRARREDALRRGRPRPDRAGRRRGRGPRRRSSPSRARRSAPCPTCRRSRPPRSTPGRPSAPTAAPIEGPSDSLGPIDIESSSGVTDPSGLAGEVLRRSVAPIVPREAQLVPELGCRVLFTASTVKDEAPPAAGSSTATWPAGADHLVSCTCDPAPEATDPEALAVLQIIGHLRAHRRRVVAR